MIDKAALGVGALPKSAGGIRQGVAREQRLEIEQEDLIRKPDGVNGDRCAPAPNCFKLKV